MRFRISGNVFHRTVRAALAGLPQFQQFGSSHHAVSQGTHTWYVTMRSVSDHSGCGYDPASGPAG
jgi:hypothetical protein